jgi:hypothetical protein
MGLRTGATKEGKAIPSSNPAMFRCHGSESRILTILGHQRPEKPEEKVGG